MSITNLDSVRAARKRLSHEESRTSALDAARTLLIESGPQAVTLKAVAGRIGRTHANLLHHFGSAAGLQVALASHLADTICERIGEIVIRARSSGDVDAMRRVVDMAFDAFDSEGAGALASWMLLSGNDDALDPIIAAIHRLVDRVAAAGGKEPTAARELQDDTLALVLMALGDALMGAPLAASLGLPRGRARELAARQLAHSFSQAAPPQG